MRGRDITFVGVVVGALLHAALDTPRHDHQDEERGERDQQNRGAELHGVADDRGQRQEGEADERAESEHRAGLGEVGEPLAADPVGPLLAEAGTFRYAHIGKEDLVNIAMADQAGN